MLTATKEINSSKALYVNALNEALQHIESDPKNRRIRFEVRSDMNGQSGIQSCVESSVPGSGNLRRRNTVVSEEPFELAGESFAFNPQELVFSALNSRLMVGYLLGAAARGITLNKLEIQMTGELDLMNFLGMGEEVEPAPDILHFTVRLKGTGTPGEFQEIHKSVVKTAMNRFNVAGSARLHGNLIIE